MWDSKECIARANAPLRKTFHGVCNNVAILISFQERSRDLLWLLFEGEAVSAPRYFSSQDGTWGSMVWIQVPPSCTFCIYHFRYPCRKLENGVCFIDEVPFRWRYIIYYIKFILNQKSLLSSQRMQLYRCRREGVSIQQGWKTLNLWQNIKDPKGPWFPVDFDSLGCRMAGFGWKGADMGWRVCNS